MSTNHHHHHHKTPAYSNFFFKSFDSNVKDIERFKCYFQFIFFYPTDINKIPIDAENIYFEKESLTELYFNIEMIDRLYYLFDNRHLRVPYREELTGCLVRIRYKGQILYLAAFTNFRFDHHSTSLYICEDANLFMNIIFNMDFFKEIKEKKDAIYQSLMSEGIRIYDIDEPINIDDDDDDDCQKKNTQMLKFFRQKQIYFHENKRQHRSSHLSNVFEQKVNAYIKYRHAIETDMNVCELLDIIYDYFYCQSISQEKKIIIFSDT